MKKFFIILSILLIIIVLTLNVKTILSFCSEIGQNFIITQLNKEENERRQKLENGEIVRGKDTILIWENMYEIGHYSDSNHLEIYTNGSFDSILEKVTKYKIVKKNLYVTSEEGFAVIDKNNFCRVFITIPEEDFVNGYSIDEQGNKIYYSRYIENEHIQYLPNFEAFSEEEQKIFNKILDKINSD